MTADMPAPNPPAAKKSNTGLLIAVAVGGFLLLMVIICGCMMAVAMPGFLRARDNSRLQSCMENLQKIDGATQQWVLDNDIFDASAAPSPTELAPYFQTLPVCPSGGVYTFGSVDSMPWCSVHGSIPME